MLKLATWNVNGIRARQAQVQQWMQCERPDVVCLQEIKATSDQVPAALFETEGYWYYCTAARATPASASTSARRSHPSGPPSRIPRSTTKTESSPWIYELPPAN